MTISSLWPVFATIAFGIIVNAITVAYMQGKLVGKISERFIALDKDIARIDADNKDQWSHLNDHTHDIGQLQGRVNGKGV